MLARLEFGARRPTLELLLPLARTYQVPLDDLVGAPSTGDPRIHLHPVRHHGMRRGSADPTPGGIQAFKLVFPADAGAADPRTRAGYA